MIQNNDGIWVFQQEELSQWITKNGDYVDRFKSITQSKNYKNYFNNHYLHLKEYNWNTLLILIQPIIYTYSDLDFKFPKEVFKTTSRSVEVDFDMKSLINEPFENSQKINFARVHFFISNPVIKNYMENLFKNKLDTTKTALPDKKIIKKILKQSLKKGFIIKTQMPDCIQIYDKRFERLAMVFETMVTAGYFFWTFAWCIIPSIYYIIEGISFGLLESCGFFMVFIAACMQGFFWFMTTIWGPFAIIGSICMAFGFFPLIMSEIFKVITGCNSNFGFLNS